MSCFCTFDVSLPSPSLGKGLFPPFSHHGKCCSYECGFEGGSSLACWVPYFIAVVFRGKELLHDTRGDRAHIFRQHNRYGAAKGWVAGSNCVLTHDTCGQVCASYVHSTNIFGCSDQGSKFWFVVGNVSAIWITRRLTPVRICFREAPMYVKSLMLTTIGLIAGAKPNPQVSGLWVLGVNLAFQFSKGPPSSRPRPLICLIMPSIAHDAARAQSLLPWLHHAAFHCRGHVWNMGMGRAVVGVCQYRVKI